MLFLCFLHYVNNFFTSRQQIWPHYHTRANREVLTWKLTLKNRPLSLSHIAPIRKVIYDLAGNLFLKSYYIVREVRAVHKPLFNIDLFSNLKAILSPIRVYSSLLPNRLLKQRSNLKHTHSKCVTYVTVSALQGTYKLSDESIRKTPVAISNS